MESEAGQKGKDWNDDDGNRYGKMMNELDEKIEAKELEIEKLEDKLYPKAKEVKPGDKTRDALKSNLEDIQKSQKSWPDRTPKEQAEIYKKRYHMSDDIQTIIDVMSDMGITK
jgi:FtsZ-binding cell division protein ZapB